MRLTIFKPFLLSLFFLFCVSLITACGKGDQQNDQSVESIAITPTKTSPIIGDSFELNVTIHYRDTTFRSITNDVRWKSSKPEVAKQIKDNEMQCVSEGESVFTAEYQDFKGEITIPCKAKLAPVEIKISELDSFTVKQGTVFTLTTEITMNDGSTAAENVTVIWSVKSKDETEDTLATINKDSGEFTAVRYGAVTVTASIADTELSYAQDYTISAIPEFIRLRASSNENNNPSSTDPIIPIDFIEADNGDLYYNLNYGDKASIDIIRISTDGSANQISSSSALFWDITNPDNDKNSNSISIINGTIRILNPGKAVVSIKINGISSANKIYVQVEESLALNVTKDTGGRIELKWKPKFNTSEYKLQWNTQDRPEIIKTVSLTDTVYEQDKVDDGKTYGYRISYKMQNGEFSAFSPTITVAPHLSTWRIRNSFPSRSLANSVILNDKIYVLGGLVTANDDSLASSDEIWAYDLKFHSWNLISTTLLNARHSSTICLIDQRIYIFGGINIDTATTIIPDIEVYHPFSNTISTIDSSTLTFTPTKNAACSVNGNTIYLSGGSDGTSVLSDIYKFEISDTDSTVLTQIESNIPMSLARQAHSSVISNEVLYIAGGETTESTEPTTARDVTSTTEVFDIFNNNWLSVNNTGSLKKPRSHFSMILIEDEIYSIGGSDASNAAINSVERLDTTNDIKEWIDGDNMPYDNQEFIAQYYPSNQSIYVFGGSNNALQNNKNANQIVYNFKYFAWDPALISQENIRQYSAETLDEIIYLIGGINEKGQAQKTTQAYNISTNTWVINDPQPASMQEARYDATSVINSNTDQPAIYVIGGKSSTATPLDSIEIYFPRFGQNTWTTFSAKMENARSEACSVLLGNFIYVFGGVNSIKIVDTIERFHIKDKTWETRPLTQTFSRAGMSCTTINNIVYLIGGYEDFKNRRPTDLVDMYFPNENKLVAGTIQLKQALIKPAITTLNGRIFAFGGIINDSKIDNKFIGTNNTSLFTPFSRSWNNTTAVPNLFTASNNPVAVTINNKIYVFSANHEPIDQLPPLQRNNISTLLILD